ncbi:FMN-binding negative transcriptional regulator [Salipiger sp. IMCC34102]|uniref:FMN-binding negative transcriptional regulator n=1 Tax=Salipiger sp. IMCC34102 TaxID=2510647 RepID=UPI00101C170A|nr:FMN-binding negative transcriptional regulator [Salipiger sp. IMCC34102]RYH01685.1 FMN-binding negative transcriptional regulator [Salipiger sp. IMCC34102]
MHPNPAFRGTDAQRSLAFARDRAFGTLCVNGDPVPHLAHVPFLLAENGKSADLHLVRSNPIARLGMVPARLAVAGPDAYVSPDWYGLPDQVPTWNYVAVHLTGTLHPLSPDALRDLLDRETEHFEARLPKRPWTTTKMTPLVLERMMRQIVPVRLAITDVDSTWKLGQNKPEAARRAAADRIADGHGQALDDLARLMRTPPEP